MFSGGCHHGPEKILTPIMTKNQEMLHALSGEDWGRLDRFAQSWNRRRATPWQAKMRQQLGGDKYMDWNFVWN